MWVVPGTKDTPVGVTKQLVRGLRTNSGGGHSNIFSCNHLVAVTVRVVPGTEYTPVGVTKLLKTAGQRLEVTEN